MFCSCITPSFRDSSLPSFFLRWYLGKENLCGVRRGDSYPQTLTETFLYLRSGDICEGSLIKGKAWSLALANSRFGCHCHWIVAWVSALETLTQGHLVPPPAPTLSGPAASLAVFHIHHGDGTSGYRESRSNLVPFLSTSSSPFLPEWEQLMLTLGTLPAIQHTHTLKSVSRCGVGVLNIIPLIHSPQPWHPILCFPFLPPSLLFEHVPSPGLFALPSLKASP